MVKKSSTYKHPSSHLNSLLEEKQVSQRELASIIQVTLSVLNSFLQGIKPMTAELAVKLEAAGYGDAVSWLKMQNEYDWKKALEYDLKKALEETEDETVLIRNWNEIQQIIPNRYFKKNGIITSDLKSNIDNILKVYNVTSVDEFINYHKNYTFAHYRKSSAFAEQRNNVIAWSTYAEYLVKETKVKSFNHDSKDELVSKLNKLFSKNNDSLLSDTKTLLAKYGIKFDTLDRPPKTPVDGKSFMSNGSPAIILSLKYKRLDNFAFTLLHELGHVYLHLTKDYQDDSFYTNSSQNDILEFEANEFARNSLIPSEIWEEFEYSNAVFSDSAILELAKEIGVHPAIIRGRVCYEHNNYYRRKSSITNLNRISFE